MQVYCVFRSIAVTNEGTALQETFDSLQAIFDSDDKAEIYKNEHPPKIRKHMHVEMWQVQ